MATSIVFTGEVATLAGAAHGYVWLAAAVAFLVGYAAREAALRYAGE